MRAPYTPLFNRFQTRPAVELVALGFTSRSTHDLGILGLVNLCVKSYCNNVELGITGVLFFDGAQFGLVLEGHRDIIEDRWQVIQRDQRHDAITVIGQKNIGQRRFSNWTVHIQDAESIVMLFPELAGLIQPLKGSRSSDVARMMAAYPVSVHRHQMLRDYVPTLH